MCARLLHWGLESKMKIFKWAQQGTFKICPNLIFDTIPFVLDPPPPKKKRQINIHSDAKNTTNKANTTNSL